MFIDSYLCMGQNGQLNVFESLAHSLHRGILSHPDHLPYLRSRQFESLGFFKLP